MIRNSRRIIITEISAAG